MKHIFFTAGAVALMALASCSNDETVKNDVANADLIKYQVVTSNSSRANSLYKSSVLPESFSIDAIYTADGKAYYTGDVVNLVDGSYTAVNSRYWPADNALNFYAYTKPAGVNVGYDQTAKVLKYTDIVIDENADNQEDLLYAVTLNQTKTSKSGKVALNFRHALAQLAFKVKNESQGLHVDVQGVSIVNVSNKGFATVAATTEGQYTVDGANAYSSQITWTPAALNGTHPKSAFDLSFDNKIDAQYNVSVDVDGTKTGVMYVIPQAVNPLTLNSKTSVANITDMYFLVKCRIINVADTENGVDFDNDTYLYGGKTYCKDVLIPVAALEDGWKAGKKYIYTFIFGRDGGNGGYDPENPDPDDPILSTITYSTEVITVDDWFEYGNTDINMSTK